MDAINQFEAMKKGFSELAEKNTTTDLSDYDDDIFTPPDELEIGHVSEDGKVKGMKPTAEQYDTYNEHIENTDDLYFDNGPLVSEVESWRKQYDSIYLVDDLSDDVYIYRTLNRYEYKSIMAAQNTDPLMREEMICETCVLFPSNFSYDSMSTTNAGIISTLAEHIMSTSGFSRASMPRRL